VDSFLVQPVSPTERLSALCQRLLQRYGVLTREAVPAEGIAGGFSAVYPVLKAMAEAGQLRRGYFVAGCGATQFALPEAVDRLRQLRQPGPGPGVDPQAVVLSAADPANPYGAALPWPERQDPGNESGRRPGRSAGALVVLVDGALAAFLGRGEENLLTFIPTVPDRAPEEIAAAVAGALAGLVSAGRRPALLIKEVDGQPARGSPLAPALQQAGFLPGVSGFLRRK
jgi:ATP-dependent Lhr-like helicase